MAMERALMRLMRSQAQAWRGRAAATGSCGGQRGAAAMSLLREVREYRVGAATRPDDFSHGELSEIEFAKRRPAWQEWSSKGYADSSAQKDDVPHGNVGVLEFGTHRTTTGKRFAVGTTAVDVDEVDDLRTEDEIKEKAKEVLQEVVEKIDETVEETQVRKLQEKLVRTEGMGEVVQELYNKPEVDNAEHRTV